MAIEKDLKDNTAALNANTEILQKLYDIKTADVIPTSKAPAPVVAAPIAAPALTEAPAAAPAAAPAQPAPVAAPPVTSPPMPTIAPVVTLSPEEMNNLLVSEFKRIGDRAPIDAAMSTLGVISVTDLPADKQQSLIAAVAAIPSAA